MAATPLPRRIASDTELAARQRRYTQNRAYYEGEQPIRGRTLPRSQRSPRNYVALFVDTVASHMGSARVSFGDGDAAAKLEQYVQQVLDDHDGEQLDYDAEIGCSIDGDAALKVTWDAERGAPRIALVDPSTLWVQTRVDDPRAPELVAQRYEISAADLPIAVGDTLIERLPGVQQRAWLTEAWSADAWEVWLNDDLQMHGPNPYGGLVPYVIWPNWRSPGGYWGKGDGERLQDLQDRLNIAYHDLDNLMELAGNIVVIEGADSTGDLAVRPGTIWELPEAAKAYVLEMLQGDVTGQRLAHAGDVLASMHAIARVPQTAIGGTGRDVSGFALQIELGPLIRLVARKRLSRAAALRRRAQLIVALGRMFGDLAAGADDLRPSVVWTDAIPTDRADELTNARTERELGRDPAAVLRSIGVDEPEVELRAHLAYRSALAATAASATPPPEEEP